ncbi:uncharacterized protein [Triticum aestivum]|uniref:uncharacterized protein n=1 Tax=Triticum aestivum TaxID=4565 RepID=UPI001D01730C|nr:uncharacterized protein LOC123185203 [Triticum aestivum]
MPEETQGLELRADIKGKADVPIVQVGTSTDGHHKGLDLWIQHFAPATQGEVNTFKIDIPAPSCKEIMLGLGKENEGISSTAHSSSRTGSPLKQVSPNKVIQLPLGEAVSRKRRDKEPLVETRERRSDLIKKDNNGYRRKSCDATSCLHCNAIPPIVHNKVVKHLAKTFCKVSEDEVQDKLSKSPKKKGQEDVAKVSKVTGATTP